MDTESWRLEPMSGGTLAWFYLRPHETDWHATATAVEKRGYTILEERQCLVDDQLGACIRYLALRSLAEAMDTAC